MRFFSGIRNAGVAGMFYPGEKMILERELSMLLEASPVWDFPSRIKAIIVPHAGYMYSGGVAARAYRQILGEKYDYVAVIAPSHHEYFNFISVFNGSAFETPLGNVPVNKELAKKLTQHHPLIKLSDKGHSRSEHSLEVQLPFLQWTLRKFELIPISMGDQEDKQITILANALAKVLPAEQSLIVASSDLSHFYHDSVARKLDQIAQDDIAEFDEDKLLEDIRRNRTEMCGFGPVIAAMKAARELGASEAKVLLYRNSGDITADRDQVVGYLSAVLY